LSEWVVGRPESWLGPAGGGRRGGRETRWQTANRETSCSYWNTWLDVVENMRGAKVSLENRREKRWLFNPPCSTDEGVTHKLVETGRGCGNTR
jgi:hypothetical protein